MRDTRNATSYILHNYENDLQLNYSYNFKVKNVI